MKITILKLERIPRWKFWNINNFYVTAKVDGITTKLSIHFNFGSGLLLLHYVKNKYLGLGQFSGKHWNEDFSHLYEQLKERGLYDKGYDVVLEQEFEI